MALAWSATSSADDTTESGRASDAPAAIRAEAIEIEDRRLRPAEIYQDTPVETEILDAETLRDLPAINAIEALEAIPGIRITSQVQGQRGAVRIDGLPPEFTELLVNGQRYAGENERAGDLGDLLFANVERIEILRGPQALRYTSRAAGGVINIITKDPPRDGPSVEALIANGDQEQVSGELTPGWGNEKLGGSLVYDYNQIGGLDAPHPGSTDPDDGNASPFGEGSLYRTHDLYGTIAANPSEKVELKTRLGYRIRDDAFAVDDGPVTARRQEDRWLLSQEGRLQLGEASSVTATWTSEDDRLDTSVGRVFRLDDSFTRLQLQGEHLLELGPTTHILSLGADASTFAIELEEGPVPANVAIDPGQLEERIYRGGLYLVAESELASWLSSEIGIRREMHSRFHSAWLRRRRCW
ncbi:MAG: TonB-dependent receptor plug domain-containing protein [Deltaproteobacteria bacterium]|nr:TonB-dependent receptor plug domain-containing protein [Deltaproteobacteria bacterium]